jgi:plastocyanin
MKKLIVSKSRILTGIAILSAIFIIANSCTKSDSGGTPGANEVFIQNMAFNPATITVSANTTITWTNKDGAAHTVTSTTAGEVYDSGSMSKNETFQHLFATPGTYHYRCTIHADMTGTVIVN